MAFFIAFGIEKFDTGPHNSWIGLFERIGVGQWFRVATGVVECIGGLLFFFPITCKVGAGLLGATMVGAILAHMTVLHDPFSSVMPAALLIAVVAIALRDPTDGDFNTIFQ